MSDYGSIIDRVRKSHAVITQLESAIARAPHDKSLKINLAAANKRVRQYEERLYALASENHVEVCNYRILPERTAHYGVAHVSSSLLSYQNLFSKVHDAIRNGP
jgi:hypothetical protein